MNLLVGRVEQQEALAGGIDTEDAARRAGADEQLTILIEADRNSGTVGSLRSMTRGEWELALDFAVTGSRQLTLSLDQP